MNTSRKPWIDKLKGGRSEKQTPQRLPPRRDQVVRFGSTSDAEAWRGAFVAAVRFEAKPESLHAQLVSGVESQAWKLLRDHEAVRFRDFEHFCRARPPFGLGHEPEWVRALLDKLLGKRATAIALAPPSNQGTSCPGGKKSTRHDHRMRAIAERAPEAVKKLCEVGVLTFKEAEALSPASLSPERQELVAVRVDEAETILSDLGAEPTEEDLSRARRRAKKLLPLPGKRAVDGTDRPQADQAAGVPAGARCSASGPATPTAQALQLEVPAEINRRLQQLATELERAVEDLVLEGVLLVLRCHGAAEGLTEPAPQRGVA